MKYIMLSPRFLKGHPKAGEPTDFFVKVWNHVGGPAHRDIYPISEIFTRELNTYYRRDELGVKSTTIRKGVRWKVGDVFEFRAWAGAPYRSKQLVLTYPLIVTDVQNITIDHDGATGALYILPHGEWWLTEQKQMEVAEKDGLSYEDFRAWFSGQNEATFQRIHFQKKD